MKRTFTTMYATMCTLLLAVGFLVVFWLGYRTGVDGAIESICGFLIGCIFAPIFHEIGHVSFAQAVRLDVVYAKFFCFKIYLKDGEKRLGFASPFSPDETQVLPKKSGDMQRRARVYTVGGLVFGGVFLVAVLTGAIITTAVGATSFLLWGIVPYAAYLFFLNIAPLQYASGKTDTLVFVGLKKGYPAEKTMIAAMEIQGKLAEGYGFSEIDEGVYFNLPQLCEDEPLYAVMQDLRYRYYIEKGETEKAADQLNRLAQAQLYLTESEFQKIAAELTYIHTLFGNFEEAEENGKLCREYLTSNEASAKRILAAYSAAFGKTEAVAPLKEQAIAALENEPLIGVKKFEKILLSRIDVE